MYTLDTIDLRNKQLTALAPRAFQSRDSKKQIWPYLGPDTIHLERNRLTTVPAGAFEGVEVKQLFLQSNKLTHLNAGSFRGLYFWSHYREYNSELDLSRNKLQTLPPYVFDFGENYSSPRHSDWSGKMVFSSDLHVLNLAHNEISSLPVDTFAGHFKIGILGSGLQILNLSQNALEELPPGLFHESQWSDSLKVIDLSYNKLSTLDPELFNLSSLSTLDLRGNPLTKATQDLLDPEGGCFRPHLNCVKLWMD